MSSLKENKLESVAFSAVCLALNWPKEKCNLAEMELLAKGALALEHFTDITQYDWAKHNQPDFETVCTELSRLVSVQGLHIDWDQEIGKLLNSRYISWKELVSILQSEHVKSVFVLGGRATADLSFIAEASGHDVLIRLFWEDDQHQRFSFEVNRAANLTVRLEHNAIRVKANDTNDDEVQDILFVPLCLQDLRKYKPSSEPRTHRIAGLLFEEKDYVYLQAALSQIELRAAADSKLSADEMFEEFVETQTRVSTKQAWAFFFNRENEETKS